MGIACAPMVHDIVVMSSGAAVSFRCAGVWFSSLRLFCIGVAHEFGVGESVSMSEWTGHGSAHSSTVEFEASVIMPE